MSTDQIKSLPLMRNPIIFISIATGFLLMVVIGEVITDTDLPEVLWGLIGVAVGKSYDIAAKIADSYMQMLRDASDKHQ